MGEEAGGLIANLFPLVLIISVIGFFVWRANRKRDPNANLKGIGGWLLLLAIGQCLGTLRVAGGIAQSMPEYQSVWSIPNGPAAAISEIACNVLLLVMVGITTWALFNHKRFFPTLFLYQWGASLILPIVSTVAVSYFLRVPDKEHLYTLVGTWVASFIAGGIWVIYVLRSQRVKNTFVA